MPIRPELRKYYGAAGKFFPPNFTLEPGDSFVNVETKEKPNGRFSARLPLAVYIFFAYKLRSPEQLDATLSKLPKWYSTDAYEIQARGPANATKDQMRLMMQSLLAERFQLAVHFETREVPVFAMTFAKPGTPGRRTFLRRTRGPRCVSADLRRHGHVVQGSGADARRISKHYYDPDRAVSCRDRASGSSGHRSNWTDR
jgi:hypothetical protein